MLFSEFAFEYDYHRDSRGCECGRYCKCSTIKNVEIEKISLTSLFDCFIRAKEQAFDNAQQKIKIAQKKNGVKYVKQKLVFTDIEKYCIGRLFICHNAFDKDSYEASISQGYYGEDLDGFYWNKYDSFNSDVERMLKLCPNEQIRFVLKSEYKYVLPRLENADFSIETIKYDDIIKPDAYRHTIGEAEDFGCAIGIYEKIGDKYRIIDGHHRWANCTDNKVKIILAS